jgi:hypothetical protein
MYLLYHTFGGLSRGFLKFFQKVFQVPFKTLFLYPLTLIIISLLERNVKEKVAQISGKNFVQYFFAKSLDKLPGLWYNENSGPRERGPAGGKKKEVGEFPHLLL